MSETIDREIIRQCLLIRRVEETFLELFSKGKISGTVHTCIGQEFSAAAFAGKLSPEDFIFSNHRCHGHYIAYTGDHKSLIAELMGKASGTCGGIGSSQHLCRGNFFSNGVQGGIVPVAAGFALANKMKRNGHIGIVFIGDGTLGEGVLYESMNIISKWNIPLLIVCENNFYAQSTPQNINLAGDILKRPEAFGIKTFHSGTSDPESLLRDAGASIDFVRNERAPAFHLVDTYRLAPHSKGDDDRDAREIREHAAADPLNVFREKFPAEFDDMLLNVNSEIESALNELEGESATRIADYYIAPPEETGREWKDLEAIPTRQINLINGFFARAMAQDERVLMLGEDILSPYGGAFKATKDLSDKFPGRVLSTPISEAAITGVANGLALAGMRPFVEIMFGDFVTLCFDQIVNHASKFHHMYNKQVNCPMVVRTPMGGRRGYGPTHSQTMDKFLAGIDNVTTVALNSLIDPGEIYKTILAKEEHPVIVIENKTDYGKTIAGHRVPNYLFQRTGGDYPVVRISPARSAPTATIVTYGGMADIVIDSIDPLFRELELKPEVLIISKLHPLDIGVIVDSVKVTGKLFVVEEGSGFAGIGSEIIASVVERIGGPIIARRVSKLPVPIPSARSLEDEVLPGVPAIIREIREALS